MNIDIIYDCVYPFSKGGAEKRVFEYAKILSHNSNSRIRVVSVDWWQDDVNNVEVKQNFEHLSIYGKRNIFNKRGERRMSLSLFFGIAVFFHVLKQRDVDILDIEVFPYFPLIFAKCATFFKRKKPTIIGYWSECLGIEYWKKNYGRLWWLGNLLEKLSFMACDRVVANSDFTKNKIRKIFKNYKVDITVLFPVIIDTNRINNIPAQDKKYDIIYYGRITAHKHVDDIVDIVYDLVENECDVKALIIGTGPAAKKLDQRIIEKKLSQNIEHNDFVEGYDELIKKIKSAKVMLQPSEREGFGITVVEANACGLPVLVLDYPYNAAKDLVDNGINGFVCENLDEMFGKLNFKNEIINEQLLKMSESSVQYAGQFSQDVMSKRIRLFYEQISKK